MASEIEDDPSSRALWSSQGARLGKLSAEDPDTADAVRWLWHNQRRFEKMVLMPPCLSISVPKRRFADAIETCFDYNTLRTFVAQTQADFELFKSLLVDTPAGVGRPLKIHVWFEEHPDIPRQPLDRDEIAAFEFEGYASDFVEYPAGMRNFLFAAVKLHTIPVNMSREREVPLYDATQIVGRGGGEMFVDINILHVLRINQAYRQTYTSDIVELQESEYFYW